MGPLARGAADAFERRGALSASERLENVQRLTVQGTHLSFLVQRREARAALRHVSTFLRAHAPAPGSRANAPGALGDEAPDRRAARAAIASTAALLALLGSAALRAARH